MQITVRPNFQEVQAALNNFKETQLPFAVALSLTKAAQVGQRAGQDAARAHFKLHTQYIPSQVKIKPAEKRDFYIGRCQSDVHTTEKIAFMTLQELGGTKEPRVSALSVPQEDLLGMDPKTAIGRIKNKFAPATILRETYSIKSHRRNKKPGLAQAAFIHNSRVFMRTGTEHDAPISLLYYFIPEAHIKPEWKLFEAVATAVLANYDQIFRDSFARAVRSARPV